MKTWLDSNIAEAIRLRIVEEREKAGPQLCCEASELDPARVVKLLIWAIRAWERDVVLVSSHVGSGTRSCLVDARELERILNETVKSEEVVAISDLTTLGGCVIDFSADGEDTVELLLTAWGKHESMANDVAQQLGNAQTFRGN